MISAQAPQLDAGWPFCSDHAKAFPVGEKNSGRALIGDETFAVSRRLSPDRQIACLPRKVGGGGGDIKTNRPRAEVKEEIQAGAAGSGATSRFPLALRSPEILLYYNICFFLPHPLTPTPTPTCSHPLHCLCWPLSSSQPAISARRHRGPFAFPPILAAEKKGLFFFLFFLHSG